MRPSSCGTRGVRDTQPDLVGHWHGHPAAALTGLPLAVSAWIGAAEGAR